MVTLYSMSRSQRAHQRLEERERTYRLLAENVSDVIWTADKDLKFKFISPSVSPLLGYSVEEALALQLDQVLTPVCLGSAIKAVEEGLGAHSLEDEDSLRSRTLELELNHKDGFRVPAEVKMTLLRDPQCRLVGILGVTRDISERKTADHEKAALQLELLHAQKMEAIGRLAGGVAHDFNNLLVAVMGYSELMLGRLDECDPMRNEVEEIRLAGERAAWLTRQLLAFGRKQDLEWELLDLNSLIAHLSRLVRRLIGEDIDIVVIPEGKHTQIRGDRGQIEQVIMNLAINSRDAMPEGGKLVIRTEIVTINSGQPHPVESGTSEFVCLSVADTGWGMDEDTIARIFEPFYTTKDADKGTGLGLSVAHGIVKQHEGWIAVQSERGQGSTFRVYLPVCYSGTEESTTTAILAGGFQGNGERILLVEDELGVRRLTTRTLRDSGYIVFEAADADEAIAAFHKEGGQFDLVFSDIILPRGNGYALASKIHSLTAGLPVLLTSGYAEREPQWHVVDGNGFQFLRKPYAMADMLRAVAESIAQPT
ncbi:ATP-binding protein [Chloroflexota bacterium]